MKRVWLNSRSFFLAVTLLSSLTYPIFGVTPAFAGQKDGRGLRVQPAKPVDALPGISKRYALVIGVDDYQDTQITKLEGAANDAKAIVEALVKYAGFPSDQVTLLTSGQATERSPTRGNILRRLSNLRGVVPKDGLLLLAFAGHGIERGDQAYLLPSDAQLSGDVSLLEDTAINVEVMRKRIIETGVGQVVMILDACRNDPASGRGDVDNPLTKKYSRAFNFEERNSSVQAFATIYATDLGHRAYEYKEKKRGYFTWAFVEALSGAAANERGEITLSTVVSYLQDAVPKRISIDLGSGKLQRPFAVVQGYKASDLVLAKVTIAENASIPDPVALERNEWEKIQNSRDSAAFRVFLKKYPKGVFAEQASWEIIQGSKDPGDFKNYLKSFPTGRNARTATLLAEDALWQRIKSSVNVADFQAYLREYPNGSYAELALSRTQPPAPIPPRVETAPAKPIAGILVVVSDTPDASVTIKSHDASVRPVIGQVANGKFRTELPPGSYDIQVSAAKYAPKTESVWLDREEAVRIDLVPLTGSILLGPVQADAAVLVDGAKPASLNVRKDERQIELAEIPSGRHKLKVTQPNQIDWTSEVEVEGGKAKLVVTDFKAAFVSLTVRTEPEAEIYIDDNYTGRANEQGELRIPNLTPGQHRVRAKKNEFQSAERAQAFGAGPAEVRIAMARTVFSSEFVDTFDEGGKFWAAPRTWQASSGKLKVQGPGIGLVRDSSYKNFRMEFDLVFNNGKGAVWVLRAQNDKDYYLFQITGPNAAAPNFFRAFICQNGQPPRQLKSFRVPENLGVDGDKFHIIIEANGPEIKQFIQLKSNPKAAQPQPFSVTTDTTFSNGGIGFGSLEGEEFTVQFVSVVPAKK